MTIVPVSAPARLDGRVALVTGAAGAIGKATSLALAEAGAVVIATDIAERAEYAAQGVSYRRYDVTSREETKSIVSDVLKEHGRIDVLVLCAGTISHRSLVESTDDEWRAIPLG